MLKYFSRATIDSKKKKRQIYTYILQKISWIFRYFSIIKFWPWRQMDSLIIIFPSGKDTINFQLDFSTFSLTRVSEEFSLKKWFWKNPSTPCT